ncbi:recombinase family protein [Tardiphaga sp.]|uniref:recombinase family protein n=1 Tax=Tardiphaga sp. TaxID=1926292 RepID=UPI00260431B9|nr:recombinase family protein [Tardiphaga sp.]
MACPTKRTGSDNWYYRRRIPANVRAALAKVPKAQRPPGWFKDHISISLGTADRAQAKAKCPQVAAEVEAATRIDRLARSIGDLQDIVRAVRAKGASLKATEQQIDTGTAAGKAFLDMLGVFAEFETNLRKERQMESIAKAKAEGVYKGRKPSIDTAKVKALKAQGIGPSAIAKALGIGRASVYRALEVAATGD